jgi:branched-chain amino acid transport system ATP-binding protein
VSAGTAVATATLEITGLTAGYGGAPVLRDLSLNVSGGEVVALMGANGAGKTTTLRAISGLVKPAAGRITLHGDDLAALSPTARVRAGVVHVPQDRGIFYGLTVAEHFRLDGHAEDRAEAAFDHFPALRDLRQRRAGLLSGGEQQMLAIGRAMVAGPRLLMLDEPSMGLAPLMVAQVMDVVRSINAQGTAVLLIEQNARSALKVAGRGYVIDSGRVTIEGSAEQLSGDPRVVEAYLGA